MGFAGFGVAAKGNLAFLGVHNLGVAAEDFQRRPDAGKDEIGTANAFFLEASHPVGDALRQLAENLAPIADASIFGARSADEVDAGGEGCGVECINC